MKLEEEDWSDGGEWEVSEVREYARERLPEYMVPQRWVVLEQMPLTPHGKVDRERLPAPAAERAVGAEAEGEWTPVEELVAGIWSEVLKQEVVARDESFFELGGHSLLATQVISRVREVFGVEVGLRRLFEEPTLEGFSRSIEEELRAGAGVTVPRAAAVGSRGARAVGWTVAVVVCAAAVVVPGPVGAGESVLQQLQSGASERRTECRSTGADAE